MTALTSDKPISSARHLHGFEANIEGTQPVMEPQGKIAFPIPDRTEFISVKERFQEIFQRFHEQYQTNPIGILFRTSSALSADLFKGSFDSSSQHIGDASSGISSIAISSVLTQIALESPDKIAMMDVNSDWSIDQRLSVFVPPIIVASNPDALMKFSEKLSFLFHKVNENSRDQRAVYIPCRFYNANRSHWVLVVVQKDNQNSTVTYINTRGGNHESEETEDCTLLPQEEMLKKTALAHFNMGIVRNSNTLIALTRKSCGVDTISLIERLVEETEKGNKVADFVSRGGLLQRSDLASRDPEQADLKNRTKYAEKFMTFLQRLESNLSVSN